MKISALENIILMFVTELTSQLEMSALNALLTTNIFSMVVTELTSHDEIFALNEAAPKNSCLMFVTELTFQLDMSALNLPQVFPYLPNKESMLVT